MQELTLQEQYELLKLNYENKLVMLETFQRWNRELQTENEELKKELAKYKPVIIESNGIEIDCTELAKKLFNGDSEKFKQAVKSIEVKP